MAQQRVTARPAQRRFHVKLPKPNSILVAALILSAVVVLVLTAISREDTSFTGVKVQEQPVAASADSIVQQEPETVPVAPVVKEWPKVEVRWSEPFLISSLQDLPPSLPAGKGFYRETPDGIGSAGSSDEAFAFAQKILDIATPPNLTPVIAGVARDAAYPNAVLTGFMVSSKGDPGQGYLFLSTDGEKTWTEISRIHPTRRWETHLDVRVVVEGDTVTLFARDPDFVAPMWRKATLSLKGLP